MAAAATRAIAEISAPVNGSDEAAGAADEPGVRVNFVPSTSVGIAELGRVNALPILAPLVD